MCKVPINEDTVKLIDQNKKLREALGLLSTLAPNIVMNPNDPVAMAREIYARINLKLKRLEALEQAGVDNWEGYEYAMELLEQEITTNDS